MILIENREVLRWKNRKLLTLLESEKTNAHDSKCIVEQAKSGAKTLKLQFLETTKYIHSKYDPEKEAGRFINNLDMSVAKHVLFIGSGLGYHIKKFSSQYPNLTFSIYEPDLAVLNIFLECCDLSSSEMKGLQHIFTGTESTEITTDMERVLRLSNGSIILAVLPVYEQQYSMQVKNITETIIHSLKNKKMYLAVNWVHQKRWTINSIKNFPVVMMTPNIMCDFHISDFRDKPAIIVAAGPSLTEELENLRKIRESESAYIFSVGSAINTLIEAGIHPHATCAYDPSAEQWKVLQKVKDKEITNIPLIFGSSIGFEALEDYNGPKIHMITSPDTVSPQLLDTTKSIDIVLDSPTIAAVTFQLLSKLECNPIIFVGQNLAYKDEKRYATGISYDFIDNELSENEIEDSITIKDVQGNSIQTSESFNIMRKQLECFIQKSPKIEVINTTKAGALIEGTTFMNLSTIIEKRLNSHEVNTEWWNETKSYDTKFTLKRLDILSAESRRITKQLQKITSELEKIDRNLKSKIATKMEQNFMEFDKQFSKLKRNPFYVGFVEPMLIVQNTRLSEDSATIRFETDVLKKAEVIIAIFSPFIKEVELHYEFVKPYFEEMKERLLNIDEEGVVNE